jgi:hypothetical protein
MYIEVFIDVPKDLREFLPNIHNLYFVWSLIWIIHVECADGGVVYPWRFLFGRLPSACTVVFSTRIEYDIALNIRSDVLSEHLVRSLLADSATHTPPRKYWGM